MSSRLFWAAAGAVAGVAAYRKGIQSVDQTKEAGPLETAQAVAVGAGKLANGAAHGLGKLISYTEERSGKLLHGQAQVAPIPPDWRPADEVAAPATGSQRVIDVSDAGQGLP
ncbi:MAG: hypothetical protein ACOYEV_02310 [Candidatus Nanopelagicales bacterium]